MEPNTGQQNNIPDTNDLDSTQDVNLPPAPEIPDVETQIQSTDQQISEGEQNLETERQTQSELQSELFSALNAGSSQGQRTIEAEEEAGLGTLRSELTDIENQIRETSLSFRRDRERIQNAAGLTEAQKNARLSDVSRKQASQLADLEVIRASRSGRLEDAQAAVDRKLELKFADEQARIQNLQFIYNENKEILNKKEDRLFQQKISNEQAKLDIAMNRAQTLEKGKTDVLMKAGEFGAPNGVLRNIQNAESIGEALNAARGYLREPQVATGNGVDISSIDFSSIFSNTDKAITVVESMLKSEGETGKFTQTDRENISATLNVTDQLAGLVDLISSDQLGNKDSKDIFGSKTGPIKGRIDSFQASIGTDSEAAAFKSAVTALVPQVARGIFGEVGVLTDADVNRYKQTIPNMFTKENANKAVTIVLLDQLSNSLGNKMLVDSKSGIDTSEFVPTYLGLLEESQNLKFQMSDVTSEDADAYTNAIQ